MPRVDEFVFAPDTEVERAFLMGLAPPRVDAEHLEEQMRELGELVATAGAEVVGSDVQHLDHPNPATCYGKGKVEELKNLRGSLQFTTLVSNDELSPRQQRNLEDALNMKVLDRAEVILDIFARHARTHEGRLQVEAAQLRHLLPRLAGGRNLSRLGGGIGTRGPGEQKLEVDRRRIRQRIGELGREIVKLEKSRRLHREGRARQELPVIALVGYTNAGKSTLFNALTGAGVTARDQLFATLDPTMRGLRLPSGRRAILSDTVGFISELPHELVAAFRATLEEVAAADVILHVRDAAHPESAAQREDVVAVLEDMVSDGTLDANWSSRTIEVMNKADLLGGVAHVPARAGAVAVSAITGEGLEALEAAIDTRIAATMELADYDIPSEDGARLAWLYRHGEVIDRHDANSAVHVRVRLLPADRARFERQDSGVI